MIFYCVFNALDSTYVPDIREDNSASAALFKFKPTEKDLLEIKSDKTLNCYSVSKHQYHSEFIKSKLVNWNSTCLYCVRDLSVHLKTIDDLCVLAVTQITKTPKSIKQQIKRLNYINEIHLKPFTLGYGYNGRFLTWFFFCHQSWFYLPMFRCQSFSPRLMYTVWLMLKIIARDLLSTMQLWH